MRYQAIVLGSFLLIANALNAAEPAKGGPAKLQEGMVNPGYVERPAWFKNSFLDIREDIAEAAEQNKRVFLYFYQDGCPYCKKLIEDNFSNREIVEYTRKHFDVVSINMWGDKEVVGLKGNEVSEKKFAEDFRIMYTPTIVMLDKKGNQAMRINGYYHPGKFLTALKYVATGKNKDKDISFRDYYAKQPQQKASGKLHIEPSYLKPPYDLRPVARAGDKPLMVMFEQKRCLLCDEMHADIMQRKGVKEQMARFDVVLLDMWSKTGVVTPAGKKTTTTEWARALNVQFSPTRIFFDKSGKEVFRSEAYLRAFHTQYAMDYAASEGYKVQPSFQRWLSDRAAELEARGIHVDLWK